MNKHPQIRLYCLLICLASAFLMQPGCAPYSSNPDRLPAMVPARNLRSVETLDLEEDKSPETPPPDSNQAPPKEIKLTLEQARAMALENNLDLKVQLISPAIAAERVNQEEARFEWAFFANGGYNKTDTPVASTLDISGSNVDSGYVDLGVRVPLRTGGTVTFDLADNRVKTDSIYSVFNPSYGTNASLSISQPLLRNAGNRVNTHAIRLAMYEKQITDARTRLEVIRVIAAVDRVYWRLYAAAGELEVRKKEYELAQAQLEQVRRIVASGERAQVEVVRAEAGVAQRLEAIILAEKALRDREREFKRVINKAGLEMQTPTVVVTATLPDPVRYSLDVDRIVKTAIEGRMEMLELELQIAEDASTVDYLRNQALPLATIDYTYRVNGLGDTWDDSYDLLYEKRFEDQRLGVQLLVPLGNEAAKARLRQAMYQRRQRIASRESRAALIELEVLNAIDQAHANWQRILASRQRAILDGRLYEAEKRQFKLGLRTTTDVLQAQTTFADARSAEIMALTEYQIALVDLAYATGTLLGAARVEWQPWKP